MFRRRPATTDRTHAMIRLITFDAVGTLFSLREPVGRTYARFAAEHDVRADPDKLDASFRAAWQNLPPPLHPEGQPPLDDDRAWWSALVRQTWELTGAGGFPDDRFP